MNRIQIITATGFAIIAILASCAGNGPSTGTGSERVVESSAVKAPTWSGQGSMVTGTPPTDTIWAVGRADQVAELDAAVQYATIVGVGLILDYIQMNAVKTTQAAYNGNAKDPGGKFMQYALAWRSKVSGLSGVTTPEIFWQRIEVEGADAKSYFYRAQSHTALSGKDYRAYMRGALEGIKANAQDAKDVAAADAAEQAMKEIPE